MAFFDINNSIPVNSNFLSYNYPLCTLFNNGQWEQLYASSTNAKFCYKITFPDCNNAKLIYNDAGIFTKYNPTYIYINGLLHNNITGLTTANNDIVGELVIEHTNDNNDRKLYLCVFIKQPSGNSVAIEGNTIDSIISMITSGNPGDANYLNSADAKGGYFNLTKDIPTTEKCIIYNSNIDTVIMLSEPITVSSTNTATNILSLDTNTNLFNISAPTDWSSTTSAASNLKADSDKDNKNDMLNNPDEIYIDCKPTGVSDSDIKTYNIPINSEISNNINQLDFMKTSVNFFIFILTIVFIYFTIPALYKMIVINKVISYFNDDLARKTRIRSADIIIVAFFVIYILGSLQFGFNNDDYTSISNGLFAFVILGISFSLILNSKLNKDFLTHDNKLITYNQDEEKKNSFTKINDAWGLVAACFAFISSTNGALLHILCVLVIAFIILITLHYGTKQINDKEFKTISAQFFLYIPISVGLFIFLMKP